MLLAILLLLYVPTAHAQGLNILSSIQDNLSVILAYSITALNFLTWVLFTFLTILLDPRFIFDIGPTGESALLTQLGGIWTISRDLMNVAFAIGLVAAAVYTVITADKEFISQNLKNFVIAVVLVNFSWFFPRVILDVANVATATIYGIPSLMETECKTLDENDVAIPCEAVVDIRFLRDKDVARTLENSGKGWDCFLGFVCLRKAPLDMQTIAGPSAVLNGLIVNHARLKQLGTLAKPIENNDDIRELVIFTMRLVFVFVIHIALFFPLLALTVAFFIRIPILWLTIAFMPFMFLDKIIPGGIPGSDKQPKEIFTAFLNAAFLPAMTAVPLTVGFILINAGAKVTNSRFSSIPIPILDQVDDFWKLLWLGIALAVLYEGVFMVLRSKGILGKGAESIAGAGKSIGKLIAQAPLSIPTIPIGGGQKISLLTAGNVLSPSAISQAARFENKSLSQAIRGQLDRARPGGSLRAQTNVAVNNIVNNSTNLSAVNNSIAGLGRAANETDFNRELANFDSAIRRGNAELRVSKDNIENILDILQKDGQIRVSDSVISNVRARMQATPPPARPNPTQTQTPPTQPPAPAPPTPVRPSTP